MIKHHCQDRSYSLDYKTRMDAQVVFGCALVDFHHTRGPEVEYWYDGEETKLKVNELWEFLPFQALPDGAHSFEQSFTYFTLLYDELNRKCCSSVEDSLKDEKSSGSYQTLFAISCSKQIQSDQLINRPDDVVRSTVQKSLVVVCKKPILGQIKDKLGIITNALFLQRDFTDKTIIDTLYDNLNSIEFADRDESHLYVGLSLRKVIFDLRKDVLVILKAMLLEKKILFYGNNVEQICSLQFAFISLIPRLLNYLQDCGSPLLDTYEKSLKGVNSFKSSDRSSVLKFLGFPLQLFSKGGFFSPYVPLQQLTDLTSSSTKWFMAGTSNTLLLEESKSLCDVLVNLDEVTVQLMDKKDKELHQALQLTHSDKKWMDLIVQNVLRSWNEDDWSTPKNSQFEGSEDYIRWQFEDYLEGLVLTVKLLNFNRKHKNNVLLLKTAEDITAAEQYANQYNFTWVREWQTTNNYRIFNSYTDDRLFDVFEARHPHRGADTMAVLQQRFTRLFPRKEKTEDKHIDRNVGTGATKTVNTSKDKEHSARNNWFKKKERKIGVTDEDESFSPSESSHPVSKIFEKKVFSELPEEVTENPWK